ncbi:MAG: purine/pyrimidine permease [Rikenellaceae bacterium]|nr:purine/pyrimidine permease [Rikenellaceae bacterium]
MDFKYSLNDRPRAVAMVMYALQWLLIAVPVVLTSAFIARLQYDTLAEQTLYTQKLFAVMGLTMIVQSLWGHRLPLVAGPAAVLLVGVMAAMDASPAVIYTSMAVGGGVVALLAATGWIKKIQPLFTPRISIVMMALIAFTIVPVFLRLIFADANHYVLSFAMAVVLSIAMAVANNCLRGMWKSVMVLLALIVGTAVYCAVAGLPSLEGATAVSEGSIFLAPKFDVGVIVAFLICYVALLINELGSVQSVAAYVEADDVPKRSTRGVAMTGVMNVVAGLLGVLGPVDYTLSPGVIAATGCASRYPLVLTGVGLVICALFPQLVAVLAAIPSPVMGVVLLYLMAAQVAASFQMSGTATAAKDFNGALTIGLPIMLSLVISFMPAEVTAIIPSFLRPILGNGFVMGVIVVLLLEHVIFRPRRNSNRPTTDKE